LILSLLCLIVILSLVSSSELSSKNFLNSKTDSKDKNLLKILHHYMDKRKKADEEPAADAKEGDAKEGDAAPADGAAKPNKLINIIPDVGRD
jgi:hypothetical protein